LTFGQIGTRLGFSKSYAQQLAAFYRRYTARQVRREMEGRHLWS
jgi:hypothetical protein